MVGALDSTGLYLVGYGKKFTDADGWWRIEKRLISIDEEEEPELPPPPFGGCVSVAGGNATFAPLLFMLELYLFISCRKQGYRPRS